MNRILIHAVTAFAAITLSFSAANAGWRDGIFNHNTVGTISPSAAPAQQKPASAPRPTASTSSKPATSNQPRRTTSSTPSQRTTSRGSLRGLASYYWQPQRVASGGWFNPNALTAAHKTLPFGTRVRVTNLRNGRSVVVRINDRGPYIRGRIIDLSKRAAQVIAMQGAGVVPVRVDIL